MKKIILSFLATAISLGMNAQGADSVPVLRHNSDVKVYVGDSLYVMPRETGSLQKHRNKISKWAKIVGNASAIAGAAGSLGAMAGAHAGSFSGFSAGMITSSAGSAAGRIADAADSFGGMEGLDIVLTPEKSALMIPYTKQEVRIVYPHLSSEPLDEALRIVRFVEEKNERRFQWSNMSFPLLTSKKAKKAGYVPFKWEKIDDNTYLVIIPDYAVTPGQYALVYKTPLTSQGLPTPTFGIAK